MSKRTEWVDYAKCIGIVLVVYGHVARGVFNAGIPLPEAFYRQVDLTIYSFHMHLFFFLSGLFFYSSFTKRGGVTLILSKVDTIVYPYVLWSLLQGVIEVVLSSYTNGNVTFSEVLTLWAPRAQFWFLFVLFWVFVASVLVFSVLPRKALLVLFCIATALNVFRLQIPEAAFLIQVYFYWVYFLLGVVFSVYGLDSKLRTGQALGLFAVAFALCQWALRYEWPAWPAIGKVVEFMAATVSIGFVVSLSMHLSKKPNKWILFIGSSSMAIYLVHILAGSGVRVILHSILGVSDYFVHLVLGTLIATLIPLALVFYVNKFNIPLLFSAPISKLIRPRPTS